MADPFTNMMEQFRDEILSGIEDLLGQHAGRPGVDESNLDPFELYSTSEAADFLGLDRSTLYDIPESDLPRCRVGPARGSTRWMGADLLAYSRGLEPLDYEAMLDDLRTEMRRKPSTSEPSDGPVERVL